MLLSRPGHTRCARAGGASGVRFSARGRGTVGPWPRRRRPTFHDMFDDVALVRQIGHALRSGRRAKSLSFVALADAAMVSGVLAANIPIAGQYIADGLRYAARANFTIFGVMYALDWKWQEAFYDRQACDGVVCMNLQQYAGADAERIINNADSHVGSTKSIRVTQELTPVQSLAALALR